MVVYSKKHATLYCKYIILSTLLFGLIDFIVLLLLNLENEETIKGLFDGLIVLIFFATAFIGILSALSYFVTFILLSAMNIFYPFTKGRICSIFYGITVFLVLHVLLFLKPNLFNAIAIAFLASPLIFLVILLVWFVFCSGYSLLIQYIISEKSIP